MANLIRKSPGSRISQVRVNKKLRKGRSACESPVSLSSLNSRNCYSTSPACCKRSNTETLPPLCGLDRVQGPMIYRPRQPSATAEVRAWYAVLGRWAVFTYHRTHFALRLFRPAGTRCLSQSWLWYSTVRLPRTYGRCAPWEVVGRMQFDHSLPLRFPYKLRVTISGQNCQSSTDASGTILWQALC